MQLYWRSLLAWVALRVDDRYQQDKDATEDQKDHDTKDDKPQEQKRVHLKGPFWVPLNKKERFREVSEIQHMCRKQLLRADDSSWRGTGTFKERRSWGQVWRDMKRPEERDAGPEKASSDRSAWLAWRLMLSWPGLPYILAIHLQYLTAPQIKRSTRSPAYHLGALSSFLICTQPSTCIETCVICSRRKERPRKEHTEEVVECRCCSMFQGCYGTATT